MRTNYSTLTLGEVEERKSRSPAVYVALALGLVAVAGVAAFVTAGHPNSVTDSAYEAKEGDVVICDKQAEGFEENLPKYDPEYYNGAESFYNACYYSYRCCTTTGNSAHCYVSENFGDRCLQCLKNNAPRMTRKICTEYSKQEDAQGNDWPLEWKNAEATYSEADVMSDVIPNPVTAELKLVFNGKETCWPQGGSQDGRVDAYAQKCWEVLSWCNLLCPRDAANSNLHKMCKHCTLFEFNDDMEKVQMQKVKESDSAKVHEEQQLDRAARERQTWESEWTMEN